MSRSVAIALSAAPPEERDAGAVALARRYAQLLDDAAPAAKYSKALQVLEQVARGSDHPGAEEMLRTIDAALASHSVASDLGPKLQAVLTALGLTPAGRGARKEAESGKPVDPAEDEIARQRANRATRKDRAAAMDASAP